MRAALWAQGAIGALLIIAPWITGSGRTLLGWMCAALGTALVLLNAWLIFGKEPNAGERRTWNGETGI